MKLMKKRCLTVSHLFFLILLLSTLSLILNYNVTPNDVLTDIGFEPNAADIESVSGGSDVNFLRRSLNQHSSEDVDNSNILSRLHELEKELYRTRPPRIVLVVNTSTEEQLYRQSVVGLDNAAVVQSQGQLTMLQSKDASNDEPSVVFYTDSSHCHHRMDNPRIKINCIKEIEDFATNESNICNINKRLEQTKRQSTSRICEISQDAIVRSRDITADLVTNENKQGMNHISHQTTSSRPVVWHLPDQPVHYQGGPVVRLTTFLAAIKPVRLYVYPDVETGVTRAVNGTEQFSKCGLSELLQYISETAGLGSPARWWSTVQSTLLQTIHELVNDVIHDVQLKCPRCFQLLNVDVVCGHVTSCFVVQMQRTKLLSTSIVSDTLQLVTEKWNDKSDVISGLETVLNKHKLQVCEGDATDVGSGLEPCLSRDQFLNIRDSVTEWRNIGPWIRILPNQRSENAKDIKSSDELLERFNGGVIPEILLDIVTSEVEQLLFPKEGDATENQFMFSRLTDEGPSLHTPPSSETVMKVKNCSNDGAVYGDIGRIITTPHLDMTRLSTNVYVTNVTYDVILINVFAEAKSCSCDVRIGDVYNTRGSQNITIGLGENRIKLLIVDTTKDQNRVIRTYTLLIYRKSHDFAVLNERAPAKMCELQQACSMRIDDNVSCDLQESVLKYKSQKGSMKKCEDGDHTGRWLVPCANCDRETSCDWRKSTWQPYDCSYRYVTAHALKKCFRGKRLLFLGDSTNRGIMNYVTEQLNGSLGDQDKTHTSRVYRDINNGSTTVSFAYYPHFWLPADHRPTFRKIIYQVIKRSLPLENNHNTVLMVGGVHWLAQHHIDLIIEALHSKGLSNITMVVKGLGAGFHQPLHDVRYVHDSEQKNIKLREDSVLKYAKSRGFKVVSTFQMTMSRYKDFLEGKCACHFHKISRLNDGPDGQAQYTVEGEINAAYSQIFLHQLCT